MTVLVRESSDPLYGYNMLLDSCKDENNDRMDLNKLLIIITCL